MFEGYGKKRPEEVTTIYIPDADLSLIEQKIRSLDSRLDDAFADTPASLTLQEPTKDRLAAWVLHLPDFRCDKGLINLVASTVFRNVGGGRAGILELDMASQSFAAAIEDYQPSALMRQISYTIADLPE
jgi:hypothetical protein